MREVRGGDERIVHRPSSRTLRHYDVDYMAAECEHQSSGHVRISTDRRANRLHEPRVQ